MKGVADDDNNPTRFSWWCRECGWWTEVDFSGICEDCRNDPDGKRRGATGDDVARLQRCERCES
jgi:hypothetical protein